MCCASRRLALHEQTEMCGVRNDDTWTRIHSNRHERKERIGSIGENLSEANRLYLSVTADSHSLVSIHLLIHTSTHSSRHPTLSINHSFTPCSKCRSTFSTNPSHLNRLQAWTDAFMIMGLDRTGLIMLFSLVLVLIFLFIPCGRLSWLPVSFLLHVKYTVS